MVTKLNFPEATDIVGLATECGLEAKRSEDLLCLDARIWTDKQQAEAQTLKRELEILVAPESSTGRIKEYPDLPTSKHKVGRNAPCPCGSGLKFKKCCLRRHDNEARRF